MNWRVFRGTELGPVQVGEVEGSTLHDAMRLASALGMTSGPADYFAVQLEGLGETENKPLSAVTVGEFAALIGLNDVIKARGVAHGERVAAEVAKRATMALLADVKGLQSVNQRQRISTGAEVDTFAAAQHGSRYSLVVVMGWVDEAGTFHRAPSSGAN